MFLQLDDRKKCSSQSDQNCTTSQRDGLWVKVPVLSVQASVNEPSVSSDGKRRTITCRTDMLGMSIAKVIVKTARRDA